MSVNVGAKSSNQSSSACQSGLKLTINQGQTYNMNYGNSGLSFTNDWTASEINNLNNITYGMTSFNNSTNKGVQETRNTQFVSNNKSFALGNYFANANYMGSNANVSYRNSDLYGLDYSLYAYPWSDHYNNNVQSQSGDPIQFIGQGNYCDMGVQIGTPPNPYVCPSLGSLKACNVEFNTPIETNVQERHNLGVNCYYSASDVSAMKSEEQFGVLIAMSQIGSSDTIAAQSVNGMNVYARSGSDTQITYNIALLQSANNSTLKAPLGKSSISATDIDTNFNYLMSSYCTQALDSTQCNVKPWDTSQQQNGCSRMTSATAGGALCRSWFNTANLASGQTLAATQFNNDSTNYCRQHPNNDDCSCLQYNHIPNDCSTNPNSFRCAYTQQSLARYMQNTNPYSQCLWPGCFSTYNISNGSGLILQNYNTTSSTLKFANGISGGLACPESLTECIQNTNIKAETGKGNISISNIKNYINCVNNSGTVTTGGTGPNVPTSPSGTTGTSGASGATGSTQMTFESFSREYWWIYLIAGIVILVLVIAVPLAVYYQKKKQKAKEAEQSSEKSNEPQETNFNKLLSQEPKRQKTKKVDETEFDKILNQSGNS